ncbi:MAG: flagellar hook-basal body complex protein FliE [Deltaproteobacteria bacterium]|nr:flagellar hook-basal body complex protein FliE [Deltaproteobacteria bacterium]
MAGPVSLQVGSPVFVPGDPELSPPAPRASGGEGFGDALLHALEQASAAERAADQAAIRFANGDPSVGIHETMIAAEKAMITTRFAVALKNKAIEAYKELMNTPV